MGVKKKMHMELLLPPMRCQTRAGGREWKQHRNSLRDHLCKFHHGQKKKHGSDKDRSGFELQPCRKLAVCSVPTPLI